MNRMDDHGWLSFSVPVNMRGDSVRTAPCNDGCEFRFRIIVSIGRAVFPSRSMDPYYR